VALAALATGMDALPKYSHECSPHTYTQPQMFACLALKRFFKTSYRGIEAYLRDMHNICKAIGLRKVPHYTAIQKTHARLLNIEHARLLLASSVHLAMPRQRNIKRLAIDSTGMQAGHVSPYFVKRRSRVENIWQTTTYRRFPKLAIACDTQTHLILSMLTSRGPRPDVDELAALLDGLVPGVRVHHLLADAGYDSEPNHAYARDEHGILTTIPAKIGRPTSKPPSGYYRRLMRRTIHTRKYYGQRWQVETVNSMIKRTQGQEIAARSYHAQCRELRLAALLHNIAILLFKRVFYRAKVTQYQGAARPAKQSDRSTLCLFVCGICRRSGLYAAEPPGDQVIDRNPARPGDHDAERCRAEEQGLFLC
jgi:hypothetical protein